MYITVEGVWIERDVYHCSGSVGGEACISL